MFTFGMVRKYLVGWSECPRCGLTPSSGNWEALARQMHMIHCDPLFFRYDLERDHAFQSFLAKKGIKWASIGPRVQSRTHQYHQKAYEWKKCPRCGTEEDWQDFERQYHMQECDPDLFRQTLKDDFEFQRHLEALWVPRGRRRPPVRIPAVKQSKSDRPPGVDCICGIDLLIANCLQCELCHLWSHRFCSGIGTPAFERVKKTNVVFVCWKCAERPQSWLEWNETVVGRRTAFRREHVFHRLRMEAGEAEVNRLEVHLGFDETTTVAENVNVVGSSPVERAAEKPVEKSMMFAFVMMCTSSTVPKKQACRKGEIGVATRVAASAVVAASAIWLASSSPCLAVGLKNGRLEECRAEQNCISTSSVRIPDKFGAPWSYLPQSGDPVTAWNALISAVTQLPESTVVEATNNYIRAEFPAFPKGIDDVEFLLNEAEGIVTYRSCSREVIFVYPFTQPIGDLGRNKTRLDTIRNQLGWEILDGGY